ncbi:hypothetical protein ACFQFC_02860 [Amorphoplanes digitatis]|uniref:DUF3800 domain-containing protein n=1 Tax=Actinoplanes digitatis TaxID=1868 RepID=A0A7W7MQF0_9ACTN|nr:hypothetical protein [Actinoplanes digitatis]MBB4763118.1 hypothetical protein [Actinoplanes digitatis]
MEAVEVACDESGYEGEKLIDTTTDVFAHAAVRLSADTARACLTELRGRIRAPAAQHRAGHLLELPRSVLVWLLGPSSPLFRRAHVYVIDKVYFVLGKLTDLLLADPTTAGLSADRPARALSDQLFAGRPGHDYLVAANRLLCGRHRQDVRGPVETFYRLAGELGGRARAEAFRVRLRDEPSLCVLDPLIPAVVRTVGRWGADGTPVSILHDKVMMPPDGRFSRIGPLLAPPLRLAGLRLTPAEAEPRIQLADILAGTVRKIAQAELRGVGDAELTTLVRPYLDPYSIWGDRRSWALLSA